MKTGNVSSFMVALLLLVLVNVSSCSSLEEIRPSWRVERLEKFSVNGSTYFTGLLVNEWTTPISVKVVLVYLSAGRPVEADVACMPPWPVPPGMATPFTLKAEAEEFDDFELFFDWSPAAQVKVLRVSVTRIMDSENYVKVEGIVEPRPGILMGFKRLAVVVCLYDNKGRLIGYATGYAEGLGPFKASAHKGPPTGTVVPRSEVFRAEGYALLW